MQRVLVIGSPGAGKSTLSNALAARTGLPLFHLDQMFWTAGWIERDKNELQTLLTGVLTQDRWIIDGNYGSSLTQRIARADTVVWLDYPTWVCLRRLMARWWTYRGRTRPDMTEGCPEHFSFTFLSYVANFRRQWAKRNAAALSSFQGCVVRLGSPREADAWLSRSDRQ